MKMILETANKPTRNGRIYSKKCLKNICKQINNLIKLDSAMVQYYPNYSNNNDIIEDLDITRSVGKINKAYMEDNDLVVEYELFDFLNFKIDENKISKLNLAGVGIVKENNYIDEDTYSFKYVTLE